MSGIVSFSQVIRLPKHHMVELMVATTPTSCPKSARNRGWHGQAPLAHPQPRLADQHQCGSVGSCHPTRRCGYTTRSPIHTHGSRAAFISSQAK